ncbi:hypothetical protein Tco_1471723 [Tanacetum coccineum]
MDFLVLGILQEDYTYSAIMAGQELTGKQKMQLIQLLQLLKQVEGSVNSSRNSMLQTIDNHKDSPFVDEVQGALPLKHHHKDLGESSETVVADSSASTACSGGAASFGIPDNVLRVLKCHHEDPGKSSENK